MNDDEMYPHKRLWRLTDKLRPLLQAYGRVWEKQAGPVPDRGGSPMEAMDEAVGEVEAPIIAAVDALVKAAVEAERERWTKPDPGFVCECGMTGPCMADDCKSPIRDMQAAIREVKP